MNTEKEITEYYDKLINKAEDSAEKMGLQFEKQKALNEGKIIQHKELGEQDSCQGGMCSA